MVLTLYMIPKMPQGDGAIDCKISTVEFQDHVGAVIPLVGDVCWVSDANRPMIPVRIVERGFSYGTSNDGIDRITVSLWWTFISK